MSVFCFAIWAVNDEYEEFSRKTEIEEVWYAESDIAWTLKMFRYSPQAPLESLLRLSSVSFDVKFTSFSTDNNTKTIL